MSKKIKLYSIPVVCIQIIKEGSYMNTAQRFRITPATMRDIFMDLYVPGRYIQRSGIN